MAIPKAQAYPASKIKVGAILFSVDSWTEDNGKSTTEVQEWIVRSIQAKRGEKSRFGCPSPFADQAESFVNLTAKIANLTWGKRSTKNGDYGWLKSISPYYRKQFQVGRDLPYGIYTTIRAACLHAIAVNEQSIERCNSAIQNEINADELAEWKAELKEREAELAALKRRFAKLSTT